MSFKSTSLQQIRPCSDVVARIGGVVGQAAPGCLPRSGNHETALIHGMKLGAQLIGSELVMEGFYSDAE